MGAPPAKLKDEDDVPVGVGAVRLARVAVALPVTDAALDAPALGPPQRAPAAGVKGGAGPAYPDLLAVTLVVGPPTNQPLGSARRRVERHAPTVEPREGWRPSLAPALGPSAT